MADQIVKLPPQLPTITPERLDKYIGNLAVCGNKRRSAMLAMLDAGAIWKYRKSNPDLIEREVEALAFFAESVVGDVEEAIRTRAIKGVKEPVFYEGIKCGYRRVYSDRLLLALARRHIPEYQEHTTKDVNVKSVGVLVLQAPIPSPADWEHQYEKGQIVDATGTDESVGRGAGGSPSGSGEGDSAEPLAEGPDGDGSSGV